MIEIREPLDEQRLAGSRELESLYLKYIQAATATKTTARIQRDESLIPVFLAMANLNPIFPFPEMIRSARKRRWNQTSRESSLP
jgi:hypothetical protein